MNKKNKPALSTISENFENESEETINGNYHPRNNLNDLTGKEWIKFTKSWFICNPPPRSKEEFLHPAKYPEEMVKSFIEFFTKKGQIVFDPFLGTASTLVACNELGRIGFGIELSEKYAEIAKKRVQQRNIFDLTQNQIVIQGDSKNLDVLLPPKLEEMGVKEIDFVVTSPPYWSMLKSSRGGVESATKKREKIGVDTYYSADSQDIGNIEDYDEFVGSLFDIFSKVYCLLKDGGYLVIIIQNIITEDKSMKPLAWDLASRLSKKYILKQERIWCQDNKQLGIWGYPTTYISNVHHHYCLIFQKPKA